MGFISVSSSMFDPQMAQTPKAVRKVLDIAGWTVNDASSATGISPWKIIAAATGQDVLSSEDWMKLLDVAGRRSFDDGCDG